MRNTLSTPLRLLPCFLPSPAKITLKGAVMQDHVDRLDHLGVSDFGQPTSLSGVVLEELVGSGVVLKVLHYFTLLEKGGPWGGQMGQADCQQRKEHAHLLPISHYGSGHEGQDCRLASPWQPLLAHSICFKLNHPPPRLLLRRQSDGRSWIKLFPKTPPVCCCYQVASCGRWGPRPPPRIFVPSHTHTAFGPQHRCMISLW